MLISYNWLREFIPGLTASPEKIAEVLSYSLAEVEAVRNVGQDYVLEIDNKALGHRADLFGQSELSREVAAALGEEFVNAPTRILDHATGSICPKPKLNIELKTPVISQRYTALIINDVKVTPSPKWLQDQLNAVGIRSVNNVVDVTNYVMYKHSQPLHAFDLDKISPTQELTIEVRLAKENETLTLLDDSALELTNTNLVIAHKSNIANTAIALAGIMGGKSSEITDTTTNILIESANFDMYTIRAASRQHNIRTEASLRFEKGLDPEITLLALTEATAMLTGHKPSNDSLVDAYQPLNTNRTQITLDVPQTNYYLNTNQTMSQVAHKLESLGFSTSANEDQITIEVPSRRKDVSFIEDLYEEIGRLGNYNLTEPTLPTRIINPPADNPTWQFKHSIREQFTLLGLNEVLNYSFVDRSRAGIVTLTQENELVQAQQFDPDQLKLTNPVAPEFAYLRSSLLPSLRENVIENAKRYTEFGLFELNQVTHLRDQQLPIEPDLATFVCYSRNQKQPQVLLKIKSIWRSMLHGLRITNDLINLEPLTIALGDTKGFAFGYEIDIATLFENQTPKKFEAIPAHMETKQDLSFIVHENSRVGEIVQKIDSLQLDWLINIDVWDVFQNAAMQGDKQKSITLTLYFQHPERNLSDKEINPLREAIAKVLVEEFSATIR